MIVLDASALLAYLFDEPGGELVEPHLARSCMSTVNLSEVLGRFARDGLRSDRPGKMIEQSSIEIVSFSRSHAHLAADLLPDTSSLGLSIGDRACLALAQERTLPALTADRLWAELDLGVEVILIR